MDLARIGVQLRDARERVFAEGAGLNEDVAGLRFMQIDQLQVDAVG